MEDAHTVFSTDYYAGLDKSDKFSISSKLEDDIQKYKRFKENEFKTFTEHDLSWITWLLSRMKEKRTEIHESFEAENQDESTKIGTKVGLYDLKEIKITDSSYDVRDLKPYKYFISKMEKDLEDIELNNKEIDNMINTEHQDNDRQNNNEIKIEDISEEAKKPEE